MPISFFNGGPVSAPMLQDEIPVRVLLELFGKRLKERCVVVVQQIPQLSLKGHRRDFTAAIWGAAADHFPGQDLRWGWN